MENNFDTEAAVTGGTGEGTPTAESSSGSAPTVTVGAPVTQGKKPNKKLIAIIAAVLVVAIVISSVAVTLSLIGGKPDAFVIMTEELDGLFNPFFSTTAADGSVVSMTQIGMLTSDYKNGQATIAYGDNYAVVTKDFKKTYNDYNDTTTYTFVIKNGIKYSDGHPLTIEDVLFNIYVYLDPVYTGSATMYSTDILGLTDYRTQTNNATEGVDDELTAGAQVHADNRIMELVNLFYSEKNKPGAFTVDYETMKAAILAHSLSTGYKDAISTNPSTVTSENLLADYELTLKYFKEELGKDYISAQEAYDTTKAPYAEWKSDFENEVFCFLVYEGFIIPKYAENGKDKTKIESFDGKDNYKHITSKEQAIEYAYNNIISSRLDEILLGWATSQKLQTEYLAKAKEVILHQNANEDGTLKVPNISGIVSLGHTDGAPATVTIGENTYTVATEYDDYGAPVNEGEYAVLEITIDGVDPKAVWNFSFAVAPQHYYAEGNDVDIKNNKFGVDFGSFEFMTGKIQSTRNIQIPVGAGPYKATDASNGDNPQGTTFFANNVVYFKANEYFYTVGSGLNNAKIEKLRYKVVSASNALNALKSGDVHYATPQLTPDNEAKLKSSDYKNAGINYTSTDQLGYGYIGINAGKVKDINLRKAIMTAMDTSLALSYYTTGSAQTIYWPMSTVSWAYPKDAEGNISKDNNHTYPTIGFVDEDVKKEIKNYMTAAGVAEGDSELKIKFTIAGANLTDHPTYNTFIHAAELLNECGWDIEVVADTQALTKLSTGSLAVWAAAWGSTIDPDMYQVYHKNSTATSVLAWGYREILANPDNYPEEIDILGKLSDVIDEAREYEDEDLRKPLYEEALGYVLDLAIELPVYQRSTLYAYNSNVINADTLPKELNPYSSPLDRIWEIEFAE